MRLTWLQLSDLHLRVELGWEQDYVLSSMLTDIADRYTSDRRPDLLFVTGDIAYSGKEAEYTLAKAFLDQVCASASIAPDRTYVVLGNHDVDRGIAEDAFRGAQCALTDETAVDQFLGSTDRRSTLFRRQAAFREFVRAVMPGVQVTDDSFVHTQVLKVHNLRVRVLLIDSAWLSNGGAADAGRLVVGERQITECARRTGTKNAFLTFALMHHPVSWLKDFEQVIVENRLVENADLCLRGHVHEPDLRLVEANGNRAHFFTAGAAFETRIADNTYLWCCVDLETGKGIQVLHRYRSATRTWEPTESAWKMAYDQASVPSQRELRQTLPDGLRHASYVACLLMGWRTEVPWLSDHTQVVFLSYTSELPGFKSPVAETVRALTQHYRWRQAWDSPLAWETELSRLLHQVEERIDGLGRSVREEVDRINSQCMGIWAPGFSGAAIHSSVQPLIDQVSALVRAGDLRTALLAISRWKEPGFLTPEDGRTVLRMEIDVQGQAGEFTLAYELARELLAPGAAPEDLALVARCAFDAGCLVEARDLLNASLDAGADKADVRQLAFRISANLNDPVLAARVMP